jgi:serine protease Do
MSPTGAHPHPRPRRRSGRWSAWPAGEALALGTFLFVGAPVMAADLQSCEQEFQRVVNAVRPSVVAVIAYSNLESAAPATAAGPELKKSIGSGVVINREGHILTTLSVVGSSRNLFVRTQDGNERPAVFLGCDHASDLVLLKVKPDGLEPARLGRPSRLELGAWAIVVAESFGQYPHYALGSFTALGAAADTTGSGTSLMQMSAQLEPGNTGGAVANSSGEVVGVVLGAISPGDGVTGVGTASSVGQNLSIAIPIDRAEQVASDLAQHGTMAAGFLGVSVRTPAAALKDLLQFENGVLILDVLAGSPADAAGIEAGDVILTFAGHQVRDQVEFARIVAGNRPGARCEVDLLRGDVRLTREVILSTAPAATLAARRDAGGERRQIENRIQALRTELDALEAQLHEQKTP